MTFITLLRILVIALLPTAAMTNDASAPAAIPIEVRSSENGNVTVAGIGGVLDQPFHLIASSLADAARWCEFLPLSLNIKACTHRTEHGRTIVTLYAGRKFYQEPDDTHQLHYHFRVENADKNSVNVVLFAEEGPLGTRDSRIELAATPAGEGTALRVRVSQRTSMMSRLATQTYLATLGKDKVGFSVTGHDRNGEPNYVKGMQGMIERNGVRYFLAMQAYAASHSLPPAQRFPARLRMWFDLTERYPEQLHEMEREDYLRAKTLEWNNQRQLQEGLGASPAPQRKQVDRPE